jgi:hypothetical protein
LLSLIALTCPWGHQLVLAAVEPTEAKSRVDNFASVMLLCWWAVLSTKAEGCRSGVGWPSAAAGGLAGQALKAVSWLGGSCPWLPAHGACPRRGATGAGSSSRFSPPPLLPPLCSRRRVEAQPSRRSARPAAARKALPAGVAAGWQQPRLALGAAAAQPRARPQQQPPSALRCRGLALVNSGNGFAKMVV